MSGQIVSGGGWILKTQLIRVKCRFFGFLAVVLVPLSITSLSYLFTERTTTLWHILSYVELAVNISFSVSALLFALFERPVARQMRARIEACDPHNLY